jgi:hypothetical protein
MRLVQFIEDKKRRVAMVQSDGQKLWVLRDCSTVRELVTVAYRDHLRLAAVVQMHIAEAIIDYEPVIAEGRLLPPLDHPGDPAHMLVTGTGLSHLGSAEGRDKMHKDLAEATSLTDSMRMFKLGLESGKPAPGQEGVQPEWFYKGDGSTVVPPGGAFPSPDFALDGGEEPEIVGLYLIGPDTQPWRIGFALGNEFSDHVTEKQNYLYLAHSKLRMCSLGPELRLGPLPADLRGSL